MDRDFHISAALFGSGAGAGLTDLGESYFLARHQFSVSSHITSGIGSAIESAARSYVWKKAGLPVALLYSANIVASIPVAQARAEGIQRDITTMANYANIGQFFGAMDITAVYVTDQSTGAFEMNMWTTAYTHSSINHFNNALASAGMDEIPWDAFTNDPATAAAAFSNLTPRQISELSTDIRYPDPEDY